MGKTLVIYKSRYGSTKQYAEWIASELNGDIYELSKLPKNVIGKYSIIILGGGLYAGHISGLNILKNNFENIADKKFVIFTCGMSNPNDEDAIKYIQKGLEKSIPQNIKGKIKVFHLRGSMNYSELKPLHKFMMSIVNKVLMKKEREKLSEDEKEILETYGKAFNFINKDTIKPIIEYCKT
jgi:menaquinone-dependent protoporphyrinogen IX oxidase